MNEPHELTKATTGSTIATQATSSGRGAVGTILVQGDRVSLLLSTLFQPRGQATIAPSSKPRFGTWQCELAHEEVVVLLLANDQLEIHCHGGPIPCGMIRRSIQEHDITFVDWDEWQRASGKSNDERLIQSLLQQAPTLKTARLFLAQQDNQLERTLASIRALFESGDRDQAKQKLKRLHSLVEFGEHLISGWKIVICGPPNVGKSSLINQLAGFGRAIVFDQPGTTRDVLSVTTALDGWPIELTDTAGLRETADETEAAGIDMAIEAIRGADLLLILVDATKLELTDDHFPHQILAAPPDRQHDIIASWIETQVLNRTADEMQEEARLAQQVLPPWLLFANKSDQLSDSQKQQFTNQVTGLISALEGTGIPQLTESIVQTLIPNPPDDSEAIPLGPAQLARVIQLEEELFQSASNDIDTR